MVTEFGKLAVATTAICIQPKQFGARLNTCIKTRCEQAWQNMPRIGSGPAPGTISMARKESSRLTAVRYGSNFLGCFQRNRGEYEQFTPATQPCQPKKWFQTRVAGRALTSSLGGAAKLAKNCGCRNAARLIFRAAQQYKQAFLKGGRYRALPPYVIIGILYGEAAIAWYCATYICNQTDMEADPYSVGGSRGAGPRSKWPKGLGYAELV